MEINKDSPEEHRLKRIHDDAAQLFISGMTYIEVVQTLLKKGLSGPEARGIAAKVEQDCRKEIGRSCLKRAAMGFMIAAIAGAFTCLSQIDASHGRQGGAYFSLAGTAGGGICIFGYNVFKWLRCMFKKPSNA